MKKYILLILIMMGACSLWAQSPPQIKPLTIGDTVPDIVFQHMLNYKDSTAKLSDFKGKPVILDFFATWCGSCIAALPELDSLQKHFGNSIKILVVSYEPAYKVKTFLQSNPVGKKVSIPFVTEDSIFSKLFPHRLIPHEVWLNEKREVNAITQASYLTSGNLRQLIAGKRLHLPLKKDMMNFDRNKPFLSNSNDLIKVHLKYGSALLTYLDGVGCMGGSQSDSLYKRIYYINFPILDLYLNAIGSRFPKNRIILEVTDSSKFIYNNSGGWDTWAPGNAYCYEIAVPAATSRNKIDQLMVQDLNRYFQINGRKEKRMVTCWSLIRTSKNKNVFKTKGGKAETKVDKKNHSKIFYNEPLSELIHSLNLLLDKYIIIDETDYTGNIDLELNISDVHDIPSARSGLQSYGLDLVPVKRELEMFVLTEIRHPVASASYKP